MLVKFDAHKVFTAVDKRNFSRAELQELVGFMVSDFIERLNPFTDSVEIDVTDRMVEGVVIFDMEREKPGNVQGKTVEIKVEGIQKKRRGRPPKAKKDIYTLAREKVAGRNA